MTMSAILPRSATFICFGLLVICGCHPQGQSTAGQPMPAAKMTPAADRSAMHSDATTAQQTMQADITEMKTPTTASSATTAPLLVAVANMTPSKAATTRPTNNNVTGTITFTQIGDKVLVVADISGLEPNTKHGIHIHEKGDLSDPALMSTGGHWNPDHHMHGGPSTSPVHAGDLGNLEADATGKAHLELMLSGVSVGGMKNDVIGHAVIIHAKADDLSSQPSGNSGARVAGGVIELEKAVEK